MSNGSVLCRPPQPVIMTREASPSMPATPTLPQPPCNLHVAVDILRDTNSASTPSPRRRRFWDKRPPQQQQPGLKFLRTCDTCRRRLSPDRDIYIYRGDIAFCSPECRESRIRLDDDDDETAGTRY